MIINLIQIKTLYMIIFYTNNVLINFYKLYQSKLLVFQF